MRLLEQRLIASFWYTGSPRLTCALRLSYWVYILLCANSFSAPLFLQMHRVIWDLFEAFPDPQSALEAPAEDVAEAVHSLGLHGKHADVIRRFSRDFLYSSWEHVDASCPGSASEFRERGKAQQIITKKQTTTQTPPCLAPSSCPLYC